VTREFPALVWLLTSVAGISLFLGLILAINFVSAIRSLHRDGIPRPLFVVVRRILGVLPLPAGSSGAIEGRDVFIAWDRRWLDSGRTTAKIRRADDLTGELQLDLDRPIGNVRAVTFKPTQPSRASYQLSGVRGTLSPAVDDITPTADVVVYPTRS
jgi:hypothetical protein